MKTKIHLHFNFHSSKWPRAQELFRKIGRSDLADAPQENYGYFFCFFNDDETIRKFFDEAQKLELNENISSRVENVYTERELRTFPLLRLIITTAMKGNGGPEFGTKYDITDACPECLAGIKQVSPLLLKASSISTKLSVIQTFSDEILIAPLLAEILIDNNITGLRLGKVISSKNMEELPWLQLLPEHELPKMSPNTRGIIRGTHESAQAPCSLCGRDGHFDDPTIPGEIYYEKSKMDITVIPDISKTFELFGKTLISSTFEKSRFADPLIAVKPKFFDILRQHKVRGIAFEPIRIE